MGCLLLQQLLCSPCTLICGIAAVAVVCRVLHDEAATTFPSSFTTALSMLTCVLAWRMLQVVRCGGGGCCW